MHEEGGWQGRGMVKAHMWWAVCMQGYKCRDVSVWLWGLLGSGEVSVHWDASVVGLCWCSMLG